MTDRELLESLVEAGWDDADKLTPWECDFVASMEGLLERGAVVELYESQREKAEEILEKLNG